MSLKQYSPHLQLTIHKPRQLVFILRLLSIFIIALIILGSDSYLLFCACVLILHVYTERQLSSTEQNITINEYVVEFAEGEFELRELRILFSCIAVIYFQKGRQPLLLSRDQVSEGDWQGLVRYSKLQKISS